MLFRAHVKLWVPADLHHSYDYSVRILHIGDLTSEMVSMVFCNETEARGVNIGGMHVSLSHSSFLFHTNLLAWNV